MIKACVTLQNDANPRLYIAVELSVTPSAQTKVESRLDATTEHTLRLGWLDITYSAIEASCFSGVFFALRQIGAMHQVGFGYVVVIERVSGLLPDDLTPCATAAFIGVAYLTHHQEIVTPDRLSGWNLLEYSADEAVAAAVR